MRSKITNTKKSNKNPERILKYFFFERVIKIEISLGL